MTVLFPVLTAMCAIAVLALILLQSTLNPKKRIWPIRQPSFGAAWVVWVPVLLAFGAHIAVGLGDWNSLHWPAMLRFGLGGALLILGHVIVFSGIGHIGMRATAGQISQLRIGGLYRYSRNPQYLADMIILLGWFVLCASLWQIPVLVGGMALLAWAPFVEEKWLFEIHGSDYADYCRRVRRFI